MTTTIRIWSAVTWTLWTARDPVPYDPGSHHHRREVGDLGQEVRCGLQQFGELEMDLTEERVHLGLGAGAEPARAEMIDVVAIGECRGDPPRRGVGLDDESFLLERGEVVANGRRRTPRGAPSPRSPGS